MRSLAPCLVVILAGLALGVAGGFAWVTGEAYTADHPRAFSGPALIPVPPASLEPVQLTRLADLMPRATLGALSRGGEAPKTQ